MYNAYQLRQLFQNKFSLPDWNKFVLDVIKPQTYRQKPEQLNIDPAEGQGYFLGQKQTIDNFDIALFYLRLNRSVTRRRVGLRQLLAKYLRFTADAALVVFDDGDNWRLSFICDLKDERTQPKRYTFVFGEQTNYYNTAVKRFVDLQGQGITFETLKDAFSVEALTKEFYNELFGWYQWAVSPDGGIYFPNNTETTSDDFEDIDKKIIRLLTRLMFVWFIKQKDLVPGKLFDEKQLQSILKDFDPQAMDSGNYYNAILQNLFFATLNRAVEDDEGKRGFAKLQGQRDVKTLYRYAEMFRISEDEVLQLFAEVPFLNGGLFECLDKTKKIDGVKAYELARKGEMPDLKPSPVTIYSLDITDIMKRDKGLAIDFDCMCSKGTYIRTICSDLGDITGFGAYAESLRRTVNGQFNVKDAYTPDELEQMAEAGDFSFVRDASETISFLPEIKLDPKQTKDIKFGRKIAFPIDVKPEGGERIYYRATNEDKLIAVVFPQEENGDLVMRIERLYAHD